MEKCKNCGKDIINPTKSTPKGYCSYGCYENGLDLIKLLIVNVQYVEEKCI